MAVAQRYAAGDTRPLPTLPAASTGVSGCAPEGLETAATRNATASAQAPHAPRTDSRSARVPWIDASRALAVALVVVFHVTIGHYYLMEWAEGEMAGRWDRINQILSVIRMPLLFAFSGMLAAGKIRRGFRGGKAIEGAVTNYYLYAVWLVAYGLFILALPAEFPAPHKVASVHLWIQQLWAPNTYLWYVFALACYIVAFTALRRVHPALILGGLFVLHLASAHLWTVESDLWTRSLTYALFFGLGVYGGRVLRHMAADPVSTLGAALAAWAVYQQIGMTRLMSATPLDPVSATWLVALFVLMGMTAVGFVGILTRVPLYAAIGEFVGKHTLGIYVLHIPMATVLNLLMLGPLADLGFVFAASPGLHLMYPLIASAAVVAGCIAVEYALKRTRPGRAMFALPAPLGALCTDARESLAGAREGSAALR